LNRTHVLEFNHPLSIYRNWPKAKRGRLTYFGWLSARNFGDDILAEMVKAEFSEFWVQSAYPRVRLEDRFLTTILNSRPNRGNIIGGGTIIGGALGGALISKFPDNAPFFSFGSGVLPVERWRAGYFEIWNRILTSATAISVRGHQSARIAKEATGRSDIEVVGDYALAASELYERQCASIASLDRPRVGINLGSHKYASSEEHNNRMRLAFSDLFRRMHAEVEFVPVYLHKIDKLMTREAFSCAGVQPVDEISLFENPASVCRLGCLDAMISERLHGSIIAHSYDVPAVGIGYDEKIFDHYEVMDQSNYYIDVSLVSTKNLIEKLEFVLSNESQLVREVRSSRVRLRRQQRNFVDAMKREFC